MIIGAFSETNGTFIGQIKTVFFEVAKVTFERCEKTAPNMPDFRLYTGDDIEFGAAWAKTSKTSGTLYYDVQIDDITFAAPQWARLVQNSKGWQLIWQRPTPKTERDAA